MTKTKTRGFYLIAIAIFLLGDNLAAQLGPRRITLDDAQARAAANKAAELARLTIDAAKYHRQALQADYFPKIGSDFFNLHFNKFMGQAIVVAGRTAGLPLFFKDQTIVAVTVTQPITPLFKVRQAVDIARADETIARAKASGIAAQVAANVERTYFDLLIGQRQQTVAQEKVNTTESGLQLATTGEMRLGGLAERRTAFLAASKELVTVSSRVTELMQSLNLLIGLAPDTELELVDPEPVFENISLQQATQQAQANSHELVEAEQTVVKAGAAARLSKLEYVPDVAAIGGYVYERAIPLLPRDFSYIGVMASWNLFDFGKREKTISESNTQLALAKANLDLVRAKIAANAQKAFLDLERTRKIRDLTRQIVTGYRPVPISYPTTKPDASAARAQAELEMYQTELDYRLALSQLKQLIEGR